MSQTNLQDLEPGTSQVRGHRGQPQSLPTQPSQGESNFGDSSVPLFSLYSKIAEEEDNKLADRWQKDADGILIFTGLFSAAVATLLSVSIQDIRPSPLDSSVYLANIYQILANPNATIPRPSVPSPVPIPPPFSPPTYAVWVNSLWFLSLVISLTCAVLATSLHQWSRRYIRYTQLARCSSEKRARIRAFFSDGVNKMHLPRAVEALPALIHISLFLFFVGVIVFLLNVNHGVFISVIWWIGFFSVVYVSITLMPIFWHDSPYYAPLSSTVWLLRAFIPYALYSALAFITHTYCSVQDWEHFRGLRSHHRVWMLGGVREAAEEAALAQSQGIYLSILDWTIGALGDDDTLEKFFEAIPGFFNSELVKIPKIDFRSHRELHEKLRDALNGFLRRTLSSNSIIESVKERRLSIYLNATNAIFEPQEISDTLSYVFMGHFGQLPQSIETAHTLARWCTADNQGIGMPARCGVASILQAIRERDHRWIVLARDQFGLPERALRNNIDRGDDSVLLAIFLHRTRQLIRTDPWNWEILLSLSKFDVQHTFAGLQTEFCALWNELVLQATHEDSHAIPILRAIRRFYIDLHQGTNAAPTAFDISTPDWDPVLRQPPSYPQCNILDHHHHLNPSTHDSVTASPTVPHPTQLNDPTDSPSHRSRLDIQSGNSAAPRPSEATEVIPGLSSSPGYAPHSSTTTDPLNTAPLITSVADPSVHELVATATPYVSVAVSRPLPQSSLSPADLTPNIVRNDEPTSDIPMGKMGEGSQTHVAATSLPFLHPDSFPVTVAPPTPPLPHSVSVQHPEGGNAIATPYDVLAISQNSSTTDQIPPSLPNIPQTSEESVRIALTPASDPLSSSIVSSAHHGGVIPVASPSSAGYALVQPDQVSHPPVFLFSSLTTAHSSISQVMPAVDADVTTSSGVSNTYSNTRDVSGRLPMGVSRHENQSVPSTADVAEQHD